MRRRNWLVGAVLGICPLASVAGSASAAGTASPKQKVKCATRTSIMLPAGQSSVAPPAQQGSEYGNVHCAKLGNGVQQDTFTGLASGDTVAKYWMYFHGGTLYGKYDLTPQGGSSSSFLATDWTGTMKVLGGTGAYKGVTGVGTMLCKTMDGVHTACTDRLKLKGM